jgi:hypothetical protein
MRYIKTYEKSYKIIYSIGDIVICVDAFDNSEIEIGKKYRVLKIYDSEYNLVSKTYYQKNCKENTIGDLAVDVEDIITGKESKGLFATRFTSEERYMAKKYNL